MSDTNKNNDRAQFVVSLLLVGVGAFLMLISVLTLKKGGIPESGGAAAVIARATLGTFGMVPGMLAGLSVLVAGCWIFLTEKQDGVFKQLAGALCTCLALSVLLGALSTSAGGTFGALSGGKVSELATRIGGGLFGLVFLAAPVWLFWLKDRVDVSRFAKSAPRPASDAELEDTGVSALEAEALAPVLSAGHTAPNLINPYPEDVRLKGAVPEGATPLDAGGRTAVAEPLFDDQPAEAPDTPYDPAANRWTPQREDVADERADADLAEADVDAAEAVALDAASDLDDHEDELGEVRPLEVVGDADDPFARHSYDVEPEEALEDEVEAEDLAQEDEPAVGAGESARIEAYQPPRPSWEEPYEDEVGEAVPLEVAEALDEAVEAPEETVAEDAEVEATAEEDREAVRAEADDESDEDEADYEEEEEPEEEYEETYAEADDEDAGDEEEYETEEEPEEELEETYAEADDEESDEDEEEYEEEEEPEEEYEETYAEADDEDEEYESEEEPEEELEETYAEADDEESDEDEEEYEEEEEPEEEYEETYAEADDEDADEEEEYESEEEPEEELEETYAEADDEESDEDEEEYEEEEEPEEEYEETYAEADEEDADEEEEYESEEEEEPEEELEEAHAEADEAETADEPAETLAEAEEPADEPAPAAARVPDEVQMDLFDEPAEVASADSGDSEPEVVLEPQAATGDDAIKVTSDMLVDAGNLFLQEGRVAVSMLQKRFALDFDQSCQILDELQDLGLIGPFVDGKRRDILLSSEEWLELTGRP